MYAKYVLNNARLTAEQREQSQAELNRLLHLQNAISSRVCLLSDMLTNDNQVGMIHRGEVLELDRELLAEEPDSYCIKVLRYGATVRGKASRRIDYIRKSDLRK